MKADDEVSGSSSSKGRQLQRRDEAKPRHSYDCREGEGSKKDFVPLSSARDPRRRPLLSKLPFTPGFVGGSICSECVEEPLHTQECECDGRTSKKRERQGNPREKHVIIPAYAYKNAETGLLEISKLRPPTFSRVADAHDQGVSMLDDNAGKGVGAVNESRSTSQQSVTANKCLYPIALNGGGIGVYNDPRDYGLSNSTYGHKKLATKWRQRNVGNYLSETTIGDSSGDNGAVDFEFGAVREVDQADPMTRKDLPPWQQWEAIHNEMTKQRDIIERETLKEVPIGLIGNSAGITSNFVEGTRGCPPGRRTEGGRISSVYNEDDFDFSLVLNPQAEYAFWAERLDFRSEGRNPLYWDDATRGFVLSEVASASDTHTPGSVIIDRSVQYAATSGTKGASASHSKATPLSNRKSLFERAMDKLTPPRGSSIKKSLKRFSPLGGAVEDKAESSSPHTPERSSIYERRGLRKTPERTPRRKWGNYAARNSSSTREIRRLDVMSPPVITLKGMAPPPSKGRARESRSGATGTPIQRVKKVKIEEYPSQLVPRGIAARSHGLTEFLEAVTRGGIVVKRHKPNSEAAFVKLFSKDGGDTIQFEYIQPEEAKLSLMEQRIRYNRSRKWGRQRENSDKTRFSSSSSQTEQPDTLSLPDYLAAKQYREEQKLQGGIGKAVADLATQLSYNGSVRAAEIVAVHPARHEDPFATDSDGSHSDQLHGTWSLRASASNYHPEKTFSLVLAPKQFLGIATFSTLEENLGEKWYEGQGSARTYRHIDFEAATEGEYWLVFRGFLLLHRDAATGRFAAQRAGGFGSHYNKRELEQIYKRAREDNKNGPHHNTVKKVMGRINPNSMAVSRQKGNIANDENVDPNEISQGSDEENVRKELFPVKDTPALHMRFDKYATANAPPPSDYFLGFKSAGTQIWGRLRQAGLETQRLYDLDTKRVMIKLRCPAERLQDVAEVLRLKLRTRDGTYAPFREAMLGHFLPSENFCTDISESTMGLFKSSDRQTVIDFIIRSRIRDSGAELGERTVLGKQIEMRMPLHMHARLEALYVTWVTYWQECNWTGREGKRMGRDLEAPDLLGMQHCSRSESSDPTVDFGNSHLHEKSRTDTAESNPSFLYRLVIGSFYQPLDSIQQYFGEGVAFYSAWVQHSSYHLVSLSLIGVIVFICQIATGNWDHAIRPFFSVVIMLWSFVVMVTWRKRQNFLAYRWGTLNYEEEETTRPQFHGKYRQCKITNEWVVYYPRWKRWLKYTLSFPLTIAVTVGTLFGILLVYANRDILLARYFSRSNEEFSFGLSIRAIGRSSPISSVPLNADVIRDPTFWLIVVGFPSIIGLSLPLLNFIFMNISVMLNNFENYRTESDYRNHLIIKVFSFRFVCYFACLYYYAFLTTGSQSATENSILRVSATLLVYLTISHWWYLLITIYIPLLIHRWKLYRHRLKLRDEIRNLEIWEEEQRQQRASGESSIEENKKELLNKRVLLEQAEDGVWEEAMLSEYNGFQDYVYLVVQFGYVTCFSVVFPLTPLICLFNNLVSMRLDAYKLCRARRRPLVHKTGGIGVWEHVLHIVTVVAVGTNCALMAFTNSKFRALPGRIGDVGVFLIVAGWEHIMLLIKYVMQAASNPMPKSVLDSLRKERYNMAMERNSSMRAKKEKRKTKKTNVGIPKRNSHQYRESTVKNKGGLHAKEIQMRNSLPARFSKEFSGRMGDLSTIPSLSMTSEDDDADEVMDSDGRSKSSKTPPRPPSISKAKRSPLLPADGVSSDARIFELSPTLSATHISQATLTHAKSPPRTLRKRSVPQAPKPREHIAAKTPAHTPKRKAGHRSSTSSHPVRTPTREQSRKGYVHKSEYRSQKRTQSNKDKQRNASASFMERQQPQSEATPSHRSLAPASVLPSTPSDGLHVESPFASFFPTRSLDFITPQQKTNSFKADQYSAQKSRFDGDILGDTPCIEGLDSIDNRRQSKNRGNGFTSNKTNSASAKRVEDEDAMERIRVRLSLDNEINQNTGNADDSRPDGVVKTQKERRNRVHQRKALSKRF